MGRRSTDFIVRRAVPPVPPYYNYLLARSPLFGAHSLQGMTGMRGGNASGRERRLITVDLPAGDGIVCL